MPRLNPEKLAEQLRQTLGDNLISVTLYGPAAKQEMTLQPEDAEFPLLIVTGTLDLDTLCAMANPIREWRDQGQPQPLVFTEKRLTQSGDSFSVELLDMKEARRVLHGKDSVLHLEVSRVHFQTALATNLKRELLGLRSRFLDGQGSPELLRAALLDSQSTVRLLMRAALRLYMPVGPSEHAAVLEALKVHLPVEPEVFNQVESLRKGPGELPIDVLYGRYLEEIEKVIDGTDALMKRRSTPLTYPPFKR